MNVEIYATSTGFANDTERLAWESSNKIHFKRPPYFYVADDYWLYTIHFINFTDIQNQVTWLNDNKTHIDYDRSRHNIENAHQIDLSSSVVTKIETLISSYGIPSYSVNQLKAMGCYFNTDQYGDYLEFHLYQNQLQNIVLCDYGNRNSAKTYYSLPFFKSILDNNVVASTDYGICFFTFVLSPIDGGFTIAFKVKFPDYNGTPRIKYYDFSQIPPKDGGIGASFNNDPDLAYLFWTLQRSI